MKESSMRFVGLRVVILCITGLILFSSVRQQWNTKMSLQRKDELSVNSSSEEQQNTDTGIREAIKTNDDFVKDPHHSDLPEETITPGYEDATEDVPVSDIGLNTSDNADNATQGKKHSGPDKVDDYYEEAEYRGHQDSDEDDADSASDDEYEDDEGDGYHPQETDEQGQESEDWTSFLSALGLGKYFPFGSNQNSARSEANDEEGNHNDTTNDDNKPMYDDDNQTIGHEDRTEQEYDYRPRMEGTEQAGETVDEPGEQFSAGEDHIQNDKDYEIDGEKDPGTDGILEDNASQANQHNDVQSDENGTVDIVNNHLTESIMALMPDLKKLLPFGKDSQDIKLSVVSSPSLSDAKDKISSSLHDHRHTVPPDANTLSDKTTYWTNLTKVSSHLESARAETVATAIEPKRNFSGDNNVLRYLTKLNIGQQRPAFNYNGINNMNYDDQEDFEKPVASKSGMNDVYDSFRQAGEMRPVNQDLGAHVNPNSKKVNDDDEIRNNSSEINENNVHNFQNNVDNKNTVAGTFQDNIQQQKYLLNFNSNMRSTGSATASETQYEGPAIQRELNQEKRIYFPDATNAPLHFPPHQIESHQLPPPQFSEPQHVDQSQWSEQQQQLPIEQRLQQILMQPPHLQSQLKVPDLLRELASRIGVSNLQHLPPRVRYIILGKMDALSRARLIQSDPIERIIQQYSSFQALPLRAGPSDNSEGWETHESLDEMDEAENEDVTEYYYETEDYYDEDKDPNDDDDSRENMQNGEDNDDEMNSHEEERSDPYYRTGQRFKNAPSDPALSNPKPLSDEEFAALRTTSKIVSSEIKVNGNNNFRDLETVGQQRDLDLKTSEQDLNLNSLLSYDLKMEDQINATDENGLSGTRSQDINSQVTETEVIACPREVKLAKTYGPVTALVAFPERTTEWFREILEQLTGVESDSIYEIMANLVSGNVASVYQMGKKIVLETHASSPKNFDRAIVFISNPFAVETKHRYVRPRPLEWQKNFLWPKTYASWLVSEIPLLLLCYEDLVDSPLTELIKVSNFLAGPSITMDLDCALKVAHSPPSMIEDVRQIAGIFYSDRRRMNDNIDLVIKAASQTFPEILPRLQSYKVYAGV